MSTYNENDKSKTNQESIIQKILIEMEKSLDTYKQYVEKTVEEVIKEIKKGETYWEMDFDDPLPGAFVM